MNNNNDVWYGTNSERLSTTIYKFHPFSYFHETDTNLIYITDGHTWFIDETSYLINNWTETITKALKTIDTDHANIHEGVRYSAFNKSTILAGSTLLFSFKTPATGYVHYRNAGISPSADNVNLELYEGATINVAGTEVLIANRNRLSPNVSNVELKVGTTFSANGTHITGLDSFLPGSTGIGQTRNGNTVNGSDEIILKQNTVYRLACINNSASSNTIGFNFNWYEE